MREVERFRTTQEYMHFLEYRKGCRSPEARAANATYHRAYRKTPQGKRCVKNMNLRKFGITHDEYNALLVQQGGVCAACGSPEFKPNNQFNTLSLSVDHCHTTGKVRGLLCMICNRVLGMVDENPEQLRKIATYAEQHN